MSERNQERRSSWIPWTFVGLFGVVLIANGALLYFALQSWTGIETDQAYQKGLAYNEQIEQAEAQERLGWSADLSVEPNGPLRAQIALRLTDSAGAPLERAEVRATFVRPTQEGHDIDLELPWRGDGHYAAEAELPLAGQWDLRVDVNHRRGSYRLEERIQAP